MTFLSAADAARLPLASDRDIVERVGDIVGPALRRQIWLIFLDDGDAQLPLLIPIEGFPAWPDDGATLFAESVVESTRRTDVASVVIVWERPGGATLGDADRAKANRVMQAMLAMRRIVIADLEAAYKGA